MSGNLDGVVAVVTGAAGGLGTSVAEALSAAGASLVLLDVSLEALDPLVARLEATSDRSALALACDVSDAGRVDEVAERVTREVGPCGVLVNNAAVYQREPLAEHSLALWNLTLGVNLHGYFLCTRAFGRSMLANGTGSIVNVSSIAERGPTIGAVSYCVSKAAVGALTRQTALEWGPRGVRANAISPGFMSTPMSSSFGADEIVKQREQRVPLRRIASTDEVASVVAFLAGPESSYVSGANLTVDGGVTLTLSQTFP
ncbi:MAG TPA: SDR family NAD(P)-dependent oxidoreductase, partial [Gaiellaceae bacterium]